MSLARVCVHWRQLGDKLLPPSTHEPTEYTEMLQCPILEGESTITKKKGSVNIDPSRSALLRIAAQPVGQIILSHLFY